MALFVGVLLSCGKSTDQGQRQSQNPPLGPTYDSLNVNIFQGKCYSCHTGAKPAANDDLSNYNTLIKSKDIVLGDPDDSKFCKVVRAGKMPKDHPNTLSSAEVNAICTWIKDKCPKS
jgi:hypothetical protein